MYITVYSSTYRCLRHLYTQTQMNSLNLAAVGFLQVLVQFDDPLLILLLLNSSNLLQLAGPLVLQHLLSETTMSHVLIAQVRAYVNLEMGCLFD